MFSCDQEARAKTFKGIKVYTQNGELSSGYILVLQILSSSHKTWVQFSALQKLISNKSGIAFKKMGLSYVFKRNRRLRV